MKYCLGKFHGNVKKTIDDNEDFCLLCKSRMEAEKIAKKEKRKKRLVNIGKGAVAVITIGLGIANLVKQSDES
ncbi:hypothetical protein [Treponema denticola]|uniref:hypothetical protein n=1 Tax=Treponema denticola TaxID=158 RepID=UPI0020A5D2D1|nr:hypothetical protein [Treponema denticola]UTC82793.1 hypothetical protein HGJ18_06090 [Treponema denticola]